jgi:hypothetical protein
LQGVELGLAIGLAWMGFHAPAVAPQLFAASIAVGLWALVADGALALRGVVGLGLHRRGVLVLAACIALTPLAGGRVDRLELLVPCLVVAAVLGRVGLIRWDGLGSAGAGSAVGSVGAGSPVGFAGDRTAGRPGARVFGRATGRAGTIIGRDAAVAIPRAARAAGRVAGRASRRPEQP